MESAVRDELLVSYGIKYRSPDGDGDPVLARSTVVCICRTRTRGRHAVFDFDEVFVFVGVRMTVVPDLDTIRTESELQRLVLRSLDGSLRYL